MSSTANTAASTETAPDATPATTNSPHLLPATTTTDKNTDSGIVNSAFQGRDDQEEGQVKLEIPVVEGAKVMSPTAGKATYSKSKGTEYSPLLLYDPLSPEDPTGELRKNPSSFRISQVILVLVFTVAGVALVSGLVFGAVTFQTSEVDLQQEEAVLGVLEDDPGSRSPLGEYRFAAVAADAGQCSSIGTYILAEKQGSAVDAAIASLLCLGIHNAHSMGIGGGHFMLIYDVPKDSNSTKREMFSLDSRETAPGGATVNMFANASSAVGGLSIGVPGEIRGLHAAWRRFGRLPWGTLFDPVLRMCRDGYRVQGALGKAITNMEVFIRDSPALTELYVKPDGSLYREGDMMTSPRLADTLQRIADHGPEVFYTGTLADDIVSDIQDCGGIITKQDLADYQSVWRKPSVSKLRTGDYTVNTMPPPSSGPAMQYMLNILEGYNWTSADISPESDSRTLTYHRIAEAFKFGYARRSFLGDPSFENMDELVANFTSPQYAARTRYHLDDDQTHDPDYYHPANHALPKAAGTSHMSIIGPDGEAVGVTSTINTNFGSKCRGKRTGIIFNDEMDDFNKPGDKSEYGFTTASANFIKPGKRALSSMVPTIILDPTGEPVYVVGGSGGTQITTAVTYVTAHALFLGKPLNEAIDEPRLHHKLIPNTLNHEVSFDKNVLAGLRQKGHELKQEDSIAVIQGIYSTCGKCRPHCKEPCLYATSDVRKGGYPDGY